MEMDDYLEGVWANFLYDMSNCSLIVQILIVLFCFTAFVYLIQIVILIIGLVFNLFKTKQTVKYLIIPFGFLLILVNKYKQLK
jgi:hypothetical protein